MRVKNFDQTKQNGRAFVFESKFENELTNDVMGHQQQLTWTSFSNFFLLLKFASYQTLTHHYKPTLFWFW